MNFERIKKIIKRKHHLIIRRDSTFAVEKLIKFSGLHIVLAGVLFCAFIVVATIFATRYHSMNQYFGGVENEDLREQLITYHKKLDTLKNSIVSRDNKMESIMLVLSGKIDSSARSTDVLAKVKATYDPGDTSIISGNNFVESPLIDLPEQGQALPDSGSYPQQLVTSSSLKPVKEINSYLIPPMYGYISAQYDPSKEHFAIDLVSENEDTNIVSVADGTVVMSDYTLQTGYVLLIRHDNNLISVYKHNKSALKKIGDKVKQGELIAELGNSGSLTTGPHLHFELWLGGEPINPSHYLNFER